MCAQRSSSQPFGSIDSPLPRETAVRSEPRPPSGRETVRRVSRQPSRRGSELGHRNRPRGAIWDYAGAHGDVIASKDTDFRQLAFLFGPPPKVIWLRVGNVSTSVIEELLRKSVDTVDRFVSSDEESFLVLSRLR